jgi:hypothetical protein
MKKRGSMPALSFVTCGVQQLKPRIHDADRDLGDEALRGKEVEGC